MAARRRRTTPLMEYYNDYSPRLQKQNSCTCVPVDLAAATAGSKYWSHSRRILRTATVSLGRSTFGNNAYDVDVVDDEFDPLYFRPARPAAAAKGWRGLWRRIVKGKKKIFPSSGSRSQVPPYDPYTYAQNFDDGLAWDVEPEILSRSFSARFAAPARVFQRFE